METFMHVGYKVVSDIEFYSYVEGMDLLHAKAIFINAVWQILDSSMPSLINFLYKTPGHSAHRV